MNEQSPKIAPRGELLQVAFDVARRFKDLDQYGSEEKALKALRCRCSGFTTKQCQNALAKALDLLEVARDVVPSNLTTIFDIENTPALKGTPYFAHLDDEMKLRCPGFRVSTLRAALGWTLFWHHLK